jgi:hypothetical protein
MRSVPKRPAMPKAGKRTQAQAVRRFGFADALLVSRTHVRVMFSLFSMFSGLFSLSNSISYRLKREFLMVKREFLMV